MLATLFSHRIFLMWKQAVEIEIYNMNNLDPLMNLREVAKLIGRSVRHVWREIAKGKLPKPVPGRPARLFESDVQKYLKQLRNERDKNKGDDV
jgi:excisionase family DNA binding protein